jgi:tRNA dimethylallyltransferase
MRNKSEIHIIAGPTASGKSVRALELAAQKNGVVINADSMQVYDALPILTAQPSAKDKEKAPHLLYGALSPNETCSAGRWCDMARITIEETLKNGQTPIITGGSGLYIKALMEGLSPIPEVPSEIRDHLNTLHAEIGTEKLYDELKNRDPLTAKNLDPSNPMRIIRALEVFEHTGQPLAAWQKEDKLTPPADWDFKVEIIIPERDILHDRCNRRFDLMLESGALDEVKDLSDKIDAREISETAAITKALGFKSLRAHLKNQLSKEAAIEQSQAETRQYAKRQITWFRNQL